MFYNRKNRILEKKKKRGHKSSSKNGKNVLLQLDEKKFFLFIKLSSIVMYLFDINKLSWKGFHSLIESVSLKIFETNSKLNIF